ncbi:UNVERIFIED_CONTAM: hypothetical protein GTU68_038498 [Idotea baltica]|nr:hypothetical protein [Idotea baltica]
MIWDTEIYQVMVILILRHLILTN